MCIMLYANIFRDVYERIWRICLLFVILWTSGLEAAQPACNLCNKTSSSCSFQVANHKLSEDDCRMLYYKRNSTECSSLVLEGQSHSNNLGTVLLQSYVYTLPALRQTAFNVSFIDINWTSITMRFMQNANPDKNTCRVFHVSENFLSTRPVKLFYDCLWSVNDYEEKTYNFEYLAKNSSGSDYHKYVFTVPRGDRINPIETELKNWEVFIYVDISNSPAVILKGQTVPKYLNVTKYLVSAYHGTFSNKVCKDERVIEVKDDDSELIYEWNFGILPGNYFFTIQPLSKACGESGCLISKSPDLKIDSPFNPIYIGSALAALILLVLVCVYLKLRLHIFPIKDQEAFVKPSLLLIYHSTHSSHIKVVVELAKYLRKHCNINAMVDELDVNKSETKDPFKWYNDAVADADFIAIVSSPTCCDSVSGVYPNMDEIALCFLRGKGFNREQMSKAYNLMVFLLPYGSEQNLPQEAKNIGLRFKIPNQLKEVVHYICNFKERHFVERLCDWVKPRGNFIWNSINKRNSFNKKCLWPEIHAAIEEANAEVKKCGVKKSRVDFDSITFGKVKRMPKISREEDMPLEHEDPSKMSKIASECSLLDGTEPFQDFPGRLDDYDLLGPNFEEVEIKSTNKKSSSLLDDLIL